MTTKNRFPCAINEGEYCDEPFCRFMYLQRKAEEAYDEWKRHIRKMIREFEKKQVKA